LSALQPKGVDLPGYQKFIIRALLGLGLAVVLVRMFDKSMEPYYIAGLATILVGLAYFMEYLRNRK
jgi:hydrogenase/urease accessory protein HupE